MRIIVQTMKLQMKNSWVRPTFRFCLLVNPFLNTILIYEMFMKSKQENFFSYVILGAGLMGLWGCICFSSVGDINRERYNGTLSLLFVSPTSFSVILFGKILGNTILSLFTFVISILTGTLILGIEMQLFHVTYFFISFILLCCSFLVFSNLLAYLLTLSRKTILYMNCIEIPFILVCGFVVPLELLPGGLRFLGYLFPPTFGVKLLRMSVQEQIEFQEFFFLGIMLVLLILIYVLFNFVLFSIIKKQVHIRGTLEVS